MFPTLSPYLAPRSYKYYSTVGSSFSYSVASLICNFAATTTIRSGIYSRALTFNVAGSFSLSVTKSQDNSVGQRSWMALSSIDFPHLILADRTTPSFLLFSFITTPISHLPRLF